MFGILSAALGIGGSLLGSLGKQDAIDEKQHGINVMRRENKDWYNRKYNEDPTQRADAQRLLARTEEILKKRTKAAEGRKAVMGGTEESVAAEKEANGKVLADVTSQIAAANEARKDAIENQYINRKNKLDEQYWGLEGERPNGYDIAAGMLGGAANGLGLSK